MKSAIKVNAGILLSYIGIVLILQEKSTDQSIDSTFSVIIYFFPLWTCLFFLPNPKLGIPKSYYFFLQVIKFYLLVFGLQTVILMFFTGDKSYLGPYLGNMIRILTPLLSVTFISILFQEKSKEAFFNSLRIVFFLSAIAIIPKVVSNGLSHFTVHNVLLGTTGVESDTLGLVYGLFAAFFFLNRSKLLFSIAFLFMLITGKRIVLMAVLTCIILNVPSIKKVLEKRKKLFIMVILLTNTAIAFLTYDFGSGNSVVLEILADWFSLRKEELTMGRNILYNRIVDELKVPHLFGNGVGKVFFTLRRLSKDEPWLHSDLLMNLYDVGFLGFVSWLYFLYKKMTINFRVTSIFIVFNFYFITDNAFYYVIPNLLLYLMILYFIQFNNLENEPIEN